MTHKIYFNKIMAIENDSMYNCFLIYLWGVAFMKGFKFAGIHAGIKKNKDKDFGLIYF